MPDGESFSSLLHTFLCNPQPLHIPLPNHITPLILVCFWFTFHSEKCMQPTGSHYHKSWCHTFNFLMQYSLSFKVKFQLVSRSWNEMIFYCISELILPTLIQRYDKKNHFIFDPVQKWETNWNFTGCQMPHFMIVLILYINLLNFSWTKLLFFFFFRNMEP